MTKYTQGLQVLSRKCHRHFLWAQYENRLEGGFHIVPRRGLEPPCLAAPAPKAGVSTNFTTWAGVNEWYLIFFGVSRKILQELVLLSRIRSGVTKSFADKSLSAHDPSSPSRNASIWLRFSNPARELCSPGAPNEKSPYGDFSFGAPGRIRTCDRLVKSELLYQLSYEGICICSPTFVSTHLSISSYQDSHEGILCLSLTFVCTHLSISINQNSYEGILYLFVDPSLFPS